MGSVALLRVMRLKVLNTENITVKGILKTLKGKRGWHSGTDRDLRIAGEMDIIRPCEGLVPGSTPG